MIGNATNITTYNPLETRYQGDTHTTDTPLILRQTDKLMLSDINSATDKVTDRHVDNVTVPLHENHTSKQIDFTIDNMTDGGMSAVSTMTQYSTKKQDLYENQTSQQNAFTIDNVTDGQWSTTTQYPNTKQGNIINLLISFSLSQECFY